MAPKDKPDPNAAAKGKPDPNAAAKGKPDPNAAAKGKPDPNAAAKGGTPVAKPGAKPPPQPTVPGTLSKEQIMIYAACAVAATLSILAITVMTIMYLTLHEIRSPIDYPLRMLRTYLINTVDNPAVQRGGAMVIANAVEDLPNTFNKADEDFKAKKKQYHALFHKTVRSSSGPWKLHGKNLYYFAKGEKTWYDAESFCISRDAHLASILSDEEQAFVTSQMERASWIGLRDENQKGEWRWIDGSELQKGYWTGGEPSNVLRAGESDRGCTFMLPSLSKRNWNDDNCYKLYGWVCKEKLDSD